MNRKMINNLYKKIYASMINESEEDGEAQETQETQEQETVESEDLALKLSPNMVLEIESVVKDFNQIISEMLAKTNVSKELYEKYKVAEDKIKNLMEACEVK